MAVIFLLKLVFFALSTLSNVISRLIFTFTAYLLILVIRGFRVPCRAIHVGLEQFGEWIKGSLEYVVGLIIAAASKLISSFFNHLKEVFSLASTMGFRVPGWTIQVGLEQVREWIKTSLEYIVGLIIAAVSTLISSFFNYLNEVFSWASATGFRVSGRTIQVGLEQVQEWIKACLEYVVHLIIDTASTLISSFFDHMKEAFLESAKATGSAVGELVDKTRTSLDGLLEDLQTGLNGLSEMIGKVLTDLWNNYKEAIGYVVENA